MGEFGVQAGVNMPPLLATQPPRTYVAVELMLPLLERTTAPFALEFT